MATNELKPRDIVEWARIFRAIGIDPTTTALWSGVFADTKFKFSQGEWDMVDFLPTILVESQNLTRLKEGGSYSVQRIRQLGMASSEGTRWRSLVLRAGELSYNADKFFEACYAGRGGNGPEGSGDGKRYPGRGLIQLTFKDGYAWQGDRSGQDLLGLPELAEQPHFALEFAVDWWEGNVPDALLGNVKAIRRRVNGGIFGLPEVEAMKAKLLEVGL